MLDDWINILVAWVTRLVPEGTMLSYSWMVQALLAVILVGLVCGSVGSLVVGNRMAFFSDALAHCAFAGVALGILLGILFGAGYVFLHRWITVILVVSGIIMGLLIAFVREKTGQASDTIIGVFFAGAMGLGAIFLKAGAARQFLPPEDFLFGNLITLDAVNLAELVFLVLVVGVALCLLYNQVVLASFNTSLARSRGIKVRLCNYLFIILLALIVNICLRTVGVLLINALLIVPAATAANLSRNMRQLFTLSMILCMLCGVGGLWISWELSQNWHFTPGESGAIVVLAVLLFFLSILVSPLLRDKRRAGAVSNGPMSANEPAP